MIDPSWQFPNTLAYLKKVGARFPEPGAARPVPLVPEPAAPAVPARPVARPGQIPFLAKTAAQVGIGMLESVWEFARGTGKLAASGYGQAFEAIRRGRPEALLPPAVGEGLGQLAIDIYGSLKKINAEALEAKARGESVLTPTVQVQVDSALKTFEENPGRASGRLMGQVALILFPGKMLEGARGLEAFARGGRAARAAVPAARAAEVAIPAGGVASVGRGAVAPTRPPRTSFRAFASRAQQEFEARRAAAQASGMTPPVVREALPAAPAQPAIVAVAEAPLIRARQVETRPGAVPRAAPQPVVAPSVAPAPKPEINLEEIQKIRDLKKLGYSADQIAVMSAEASEEILAKGIRGTGFKRVGGKMVPARSEVPVEGPKAVAPVPAPEVAPPAAPAAGVADIGHGPTTKAGFERLGRDLDILHSHPTRRGVTNDAAYRNFFKKLIQAAEDAEMPQVAKAAAEAEAAFFSGNTAGGISKSEEVLNTLHQTHDFVTRRRLMIAQPAFAQPAVAEAVVVKGGVPAVGSPEARAAIERVRAAEAARAKTQVKVPKAEPRIASGISMERAGIKPAVSFDIPGARAAQNMVEIGGETIERAGYDAVSQTLALKMRGEPHVRVWGNVPEDTYKALVGAEHPGQVFGQMIRGKSGMALAGEQLAVKATADRVAGMLAQGVDAKEVAKFIRSVSRDVKPDDFVAAVREMYQIPRGPAEFGEWAKAWRSVERRAVAAAPVTEVAPADEAVIRATVEGGLVPEEQVAKGMHIEVPDESVKAVGGKDFVIKPIEGASEVEKVKAYNDLAEAADRKIPGFGDALIRARTVKDRTLGEINLAFKAIKFQKLTAAEDRNLYEVAMGFAQPVSPRVARAAQAVEKLQVLAGDTSSMALFRLMRGAVDPWKIGKMHVNDLGNLWVKQGVDRATAMAAADALKKSVDAGKGAWQFFAGNKAIVPPYEIVRPMKWTVPQYLERMALRVGLKGEFISEENLWRIVKDIPGRDVKILRYGLRHLLGYHEAVDPVLRVWRDLGRFENAITMSVLSPITAVKQFSQIAIMSMRLPARDIASGLLKLLSMDAHREAIAKGATLANFRELGGMMLAGMEDSTFFGRAAEWYSTQVGARVIRGSAVSLADNVTRVFGYWAKKNELTRLVEAAISGNRGAARRLIGEKFDVDLIRSGRGSWTDEIEMLAKEYADRYGLRSDILGSPIYLSHPAFQFARGLNMFATNMTKLFYKELIHPALRPEGLAGLMQVTLRAARLGGYGTFIGTLLSRTIRFMQGKEQPKTVAAEIASAWATLGTLGLADRIVDGIVDREGNLLPLDKISGSIANSFLQVSQQVLFGAGPRVIGGIPGKLLKKPLTLIPGYGNLLQMLYEALAENEAEGQQQPLKPLKPLKSLKPLGK